MEKAKISAAQLFVLIVLFELSSSLLIFPGQSAEQDAWIAILFGTVGGLALFMMHHFFYQVNPDASPYETLMSIFGKPVGWGLSFIYIVYYCYIAARVLRDFGEMLLTSAYPNTPIIFANGLLIAVCIFTVRKGIEVLARSGELLFGIMFWLAVIGLILIVSSGLIKPKELLPIFGNGPGPMFHAVFTQTLYFPFGEIIVFTLILPYLKEKKQAKKAGLLGIAISGIILAFNVALNISVLGVDLNMRSRFPLLSTIQTIQVAEFLDRLDVFFMLVLVIGGFFKMSIFMYAVTEGVTVLFKLKNPSKIVHVIGIIILILSVSIASNISEHVKEGIEFVPLYVHLPMQVILPAFICLVAYAKMKKNKKKTV
ncbi:GerAB/ArcD/ProY family transporter [Bacillus paralicheniformis]|uniref:Spore germination protein GerKB n=1 Tax=Bacillus paralicheniformis TaxID=1648923 RepID=A0A7Z0WW44_9BACI|nr:GerAB/ArcD/ProY family transporter [Bacillus paralicheniformis]MDU0414667.1 GerAB/ArcD/ProY family transporter [Bacillus paralicheniformis]MDW6055777.1 GerAB/ArcD/ProY family transporter [Bacillus paralicheniformis]OLF90754.1 Spore germination protein GerKB [Bacillus paralicheniformis]